MELTAEDTENHRGGCNFVLEAQFTTEFVVEPASMGASLQVAQEGFPATPEADEFFLGCQQGPSIQVHDFSMDDVDRFGAGALGSPGMRRMSPVNTTRNPAPDWT